MKNLQKAMNEETMYINDRMNGINTSLIERLKQYGYETLDEYFLDKKEYKFNNWKPELYYVDIKTLTTELEKAVQSKQYGIYISKTDGPYAFHGSDEIDYELCENLGVCVAEVYHQGGTIIGDVEDLGIEIIAPLDIGLDTNYLLNKFSEIISKYEENVEINGNDILINGEKVLGSMQRNIGDTFVWAAQISFGEHNELIEKICHKKSIKKPGRIVNLSKEKLEEEVLKWLQKL